MDRETDRRKNPSRKKSTGVTYLVTLDPQGSRWNITRNDVPTGGFAREKNTAIGMAYREASLEQAGSKEPVTVWSVVAGKRKKEWPTA